MAKNPRFIPLVAAAVLVAVPALPDTLGSYRDQLGSRVRMEAAARERVLRLRTALGTQAVPFAAATDAAGPFRRPAPGTDNGSKNSGSQLIKQFLQRAANDLRTIEQRGRPPTVNPQTFLSEVERQQELRRINFCQAEIYGRFPQLVDEYVGYLMRRRAGAAGLPDSTNDATTARLRALTAHLRSQPQAAANATIEARLGPLESAEFVDGQLTALNFVRREGTTITSAVPVSLSTLATFRAGDDEYFVAILRCFATYLRDRVEGRRQGPETRAKLDLVLPDVAEKIVGATRVTETLGSLTPAQQAFLLDVFLQAGGAEFPAEEEMGMPDDLAQWNRRENPSLVALFAQEIRRTEGVAAQTAAFARFVTDDRYYRVQSELLYRLEDSLQQEADMRRRTRQVIEGMRRPR